MGLFGGIGKALKGVDWGNVMAGLQSAGAMAQGDYGTAAQIQGLQRRQRDERDEAEAKAQQAQGQVEALVRAGIPQADAIAIVQSGAADTVLGQRFGQQGDQYGYTEDNAGNQWRYNKGTGQYDAQPVFVDRNPRTYFDPSQNRVVTVPNSYAGGQSGYAQQQGGTPPPAAIDALRNNPQLRDDFERKYGPGSAARVLGGGASNGAATFPGFQRLPGGGQLRI